MLYFSSEQRYVMSKLSGILVLLNNFPKCSFRDGILNMYSPWISNALTKWLYLNFKRFKIVRFFPLKILPFLVCKVKNPNLPHNYATLITFGYIYLRQLLIF